MFNLPVCEDHLAKPYIYGNDNLSQVMFDLPVYSDHDLSVPIVVYTDMFYMYNTLSLSWTFCLPPRGDSNSSSLASLLPMASLFGVVARDPRPELLRDPDDVLCVLVLVVSDDLPPLVVFVTFVTVRLLLELASHFDFAELFVEVRVVVPNEEGDPTRFDPNDPVRLDLFTDEAAENELLVLLLLVGLVTERPARPVIGSVLLLLPGEGGRDDCDDDVEDVVDRNESFLSSDDDLWSRFISSCKQKE